MIKRRNFILILLSVSLIILSGCAVSGYDAKKASIHTPAIIAKPVVAEYEYSQVKVIGTAKGKVKAYFSLNDLKNEAVQNALKPNNADMLIEPIFSVQKISYPFVPFAKTEYIVTVTGYPAKIIRLREFTNDDNVWSKDTPVSGAEEQPKGNIFSRMIKGITG